MITYNGIELDYRADTLQSLIIKGGLTKIDNLTDRTGTSSTQFNLPRTAKNELAFGNITTEGSELTTSGSAFITLEGNVFSQGVLYVQGYDQDNFKCLFMGANNDVIGRLKVKPLKSLMDFNRRFLLSDANVRNKIENLGGGSLGSEIHFHFGSGFLRSLSDAGTLNRNTVAPFFTVRSMLHKMFKAEGFDLVSNFFDSDFGQAIDYSNFGSADDILSSNSYTGGANIFPSGIGSNYFNGFGLGTPSSGNNSINVVSPTPNLAFVNNGDAYQIVNSCDKIKLSGVFEYQGNANIETAQIVVIVLKTSYPIDIVWDNVEVENTMGLLQEGTNYFETEIDATFLAADEINVMVQVNNGSALSTIDYTGSSLTCTEFNISNNNRQISDSVWVGDYVGKQNQLEFLKGVLNDLNLVLDIDGTTAYIELQDEGTEPVGTTPASLPSIATSQYDLTNIAQESTSTNIEYLQADLIHLNQQINETDYVKSIGIFQYQDFGSFYYKLNSFNNSRVEKIDSFFTAYYDGSSYIYKLDNTFTTPGAYSETWENNLSCRYKFGDATFNGTTAYTYTNADASTTSVDALENWSLPVTFAKTWDKLFLNTLNQKKNNKIIEVIFRDELGTIVNNRTEYIFNNQVYKIVEWNYDIIKKLVKAKLIMK